MNRKSPFSSGKITALLFFLIPVLEANAASFLYEFKGTIERSSSYNTEYPVSALNALLGVPEVSYLFEIDFDRDTRTLSNAAATWHYFYARLIGDGVMETVLQSEATPVTLGYNGDFNLSSDVGQIGGDGVRISASHGDLNPFSRWRVQDWQVGDELRLLDFTYPMIGDGATYYVGKVTLTSINPIPEPRFLPLALIGIFIGTSRRNRRSGIRP